MRENGDTLHLSGDWLPLHVRRGPPYRRRWLLGTLHFLLLTGDRIGTSSHKRDRFMLDAFPGRRHSQLWRHFLFGSEGFHGSATTALPQHPTVSYSTTGQLRGRHPQSCSEGTANSPCSHSISKTFEFSWWRLKRCWTFQTPWQFFPTACRFC